MNFDWLKRYMPRGLYGRAALIVLVPIISLQVVVSVVFIQRHYEDVTRQMTAALALELRLLVENINSAQTFEQALADGRAVASALEMDIKLPGDLAGDLSRSADNVRFYDFSGRVVIEILRQRVDPVQLIDLADDWRRVQVWMNTDHGLIRVAVLRGRVSASNPHQFLVLMVFVGAIMSLVAIIFLRNQLRPIRRLSQAAEEFGKGRVVAYKSSGASEVRSAGNAFLDMRARIERQIEQRTMMLSGVSHDLRTPLTRLKLGLSMLDHDDEQQAMISDIQDMERLLDEFLSFARGDALDDPITCDPVALVRDAVAKMSRNGENVVLRTPNGEGIATLRPLALTRALENLIGNALRYAKHAEVGVVWLKNSLSVIVEDDGPGIMPTLREQALKPFVRLDAARNQNDGSGVGLGLSIAHDIARRHGGSLTLHKSDALGGLKVVLNLPR
jgi:two-component system osmolarity sensor histidine kinase EnvZ